MIAKVKKMHWTVTEIKKILLCAQVIRSEKMHLKISENTRPFYVIALLFLVTMNSRNFIKIIECCRVLVRQNIAFQGASEFNTNFHLMLKFKSTGDPELTTWLSTRR